MKTPVRLSKPNTKLDSFEWQYSNQLPVGVNQLRVTARLLECDAIRYTPSGVPALNCRLEHESEVTEADVQRQVKMTLKSVSFGFIAEKLAVQEIGSCWVFVGFLASPKNSKQVVFHIQAFDKI